MALRGVRARCREAVRAILSAVLSHAPAADTACDLIVAAVTCYLLYALLTLLLSYRRKRANHVKGIAKQRAVRLHKDALLRELEADPATVKLAATTSGMPAPTMASKLQQGSFTSLQLTRACLLNCLRADRLDRSVCEVVPDCFERARASDRRRASGQPLGMVEGIPFSFKECLRLQGMDSSIGLPSLTFTPSTVTHTALKTIIEEGGIPLVSTTVPQTMLSYECSNPLTGITENPHMKGRSPGGSSGGESALHARRAVPFGVGTDMGGSLRIPAAFCGTLGFKPTKLRVGLHNSHIALPGQLALASTPGPMASDCASLAMMFKAMLMDADRSRRLDTCIVPLPLNKSELESTKKMHIAYMTGESYFTPAPASRRAVEVAVGALRALGHTVTPFSDALLDTWMTTFVSLLSADGGRLTFEMLENDFTHSSVLPVVRCMRVPAFVRAMARHAPFRSRAVSLLGNLCEKTVTQEWQWNSKLLEQHKLLMDLWEKEGIDAMLTPAIAMPAARQGYCGRLPQPCWPTAIFNVFDMPAGVLPVTRVTPEDDAALLRLPNTDIFDRQLKAAVRDSAGLPVGVQLAAPRWHDERVLRLMAELEAEVAFDSRVLEAKEPAKDGVMAHLLRQDM